MYRVELKARKSSIRGKAYETRLFLMYCVELKVAPPFTLFRALSLFLMYRVELKEYFGIKGKLYYFGS